MANQSFLQVVLAVLVLEVEELQQVGIAHDLLDAHGIRRTRDHCLLPQHGLALGGRQSFIELRIDLAVELPHRPSALERFGFVECPGFLVGHGEKPDVMGP